MEETKLEEMSEYQLRDYIKEKKIEIKMAKQSLSNLINQKDGYILCRDEIFKVRTTDMDRYSVSCYDIKTKEKFLVDRDCFGETISEVINKVITRISKEVSKLDKKINDLKNEKDECIYFIKMYVSMEKEFQDKIESDENNLSLDDELEYDDTGMEPEFLQ